MDTNSMVLWDDSPNSGRHFRTSAFRRAPRIEDYFGSMDRLTFFGLFAVTSMLVLYALEKRSHWFILAFAGSCILASAYGFLQGAWPFGLVEAVWSVVAIQRWWVERRL